MHVGRKYTIKEILYWTKRDIVFLLIYNFVPTFLFEYFGWKWLSIPWLPIALIGTAVAFMIGFKNNTSYDRMWEARRAWGSIVTSSRIMGIMIRDYILVKSGATSSEESEVKAKKNQIILRHFGWLLALRFQLREVRVWESMRKIHNVEYRTMYSVAEQDTKLEEELLPYITKDEVAYIMPKKNKALHIISLQSKALKELHEKGYIDAFRYMDIEKVLLEFYSHQGASERIKNFPYPRQFATLNYYFVRLFIILVPFGMFQEFEKMGSGMVWLIVPFGALVSWVFTMMEKIGESTENPFEGGPNDVPITAMSRGIEIDLKELFDEDEIPPALQPTNHILM